MLGLRPRFARHVAASLLRGPRARNASTRPPPKIAQHNVAPRPASRTAPSDSDATVAAAPTPTPASSPQRSPLPPMPLSRRLALYGAIVTGTLITFYTTQLYLSAAKPCSDPTVADLAHQPDVAARYDETADTFDSDVSLSERLMGVTSLRKRLTKRCRGHVLEASCGTGRNLGYFDLSPDSPIASLTFLDLSPRMVQVCKRKWQVLHSAAPSAPTGPDAALAGMPVRFAAASALAAMPLAPDGRRYATILQTMGLCSTPAPVALLANLAAHLDPRDPAARILLLEHGRSYTGWLNRVLDNAARTHAELHGCWFNRDIGAVVAEAAAQAGLEVVRERRHHLGTTWMFELKLRGGEAAAVAVQADAGKGADGGDGASSMRKTGWRSWVTWTER